MRGGSRPVYISILISKIAVDAVVLPENHTQFEESVGDLKHQHMGVVMLVAYQNTLTCSSHPMLFVVLFQSF
jgi:hypothetical protein